MPYGTSSSMSLVVPGRTRAVDPETGPRTLAPATDTSWGQVIAFFFVSSTFEIMSSGGNLLLDNFVVKPNCLSGINQGNGIISCDTKKVIGTKCVLMVMGGGQ